MGNVKIAQNSSVDKEEENVTVEMQEPVTLSFATRLVSYLYTRPFTGSPYFKEFTVTQVFTVTCLCSQTFASGEINTR